MEKTGTIHVDLGDTTKLTWIEYKLETFVAIIKERLSEIVQPKDVVSDFDKSMWFTSIVVLLGKVLPANRFLFRIVEEENQFLIQLHDPAQLQQPQTIEVPYHKIFIWGVESWNDALQLCSEDRRAFYTKWKNEGYNDSQIARHFGLENSNCVRSWATCDSMASALKKIRRRLSVVATAPVSMRVRQILKKNGVDFVITDALEDAYCHITGCKVSFRALRAKDTTNLSPDIPKCVNIAIQYVENIIAKIKVVDSLIYTNRSIGQFLRHLSQSSKIKIRTRPVYDPVSQTKKGVCDHESLKKCIVFYTNVLNNLNQMKGELK